MALTDEELVLSIQNCSEPMESAEISLLIYRYSRIIRLKASKLKKNAEVDSDDLFQEGVLGLLEAVRQYNGDRGRFQPFAEVCIINRMKNALSKSARGLTVAEDYDFEQLSDNGATTEENLILNEQSAEFSEKLSKLLSNREFEVLNLYLEGFSYRQIADKLSVSVKSVDNSLSRAKQKLKKWL
ncbi:MAG: sigma-70 family RNA polymerase sigma factor [Oscillospiraceae bacterium]|nr:sigma-70 family RNA polymerase sigma factor [Oscillospiraceae bacterium]